MNYIELKRNKWNKNFDDCCYFSDGSCGTCFVTNIKDTSCGWNNLLGIFRWRLTYELY